MNNMESVPFVSVIVPVKNERMYIRETLLQLICQSYPKNYFEVLVIDGMSKDETREIVEEFRTQNFEREIKGLREENKSEGKKKFRSSDLNLFTTIRLIDNPKGRRAPALNIGIKEAKGDVVMRVDARAIIPPDYIEKCVGTLIKTGADNVGGVQRPIIQNLKLKIPESALQKENERITFEAKYRTLKIEHRVRTQQAIGIALSHSFGVGSAQFRLGKKSGYVDTVYLGCFRKKIFDKVGLFDEESVVISEDSDMNQRIRDAGGKVYLNKDFVVCYYPRDNFKDFWKLYFRYGGAKAGNLIKRGRLTAWRQLAPPVLLLILVLLPVLGIFNVFFLYQWLVIGVAYIVSDFLVSLRLAYKERMFGIKSPTSKIEDETSTMKQSKFSLFWRLLCVFPVMHFSWALGFWKRLLQRPKRGEYWGF